MKLVSYLKSRVGLSRVGLAVLSGVLVTLSLPRFEVWPLAWVSFVPVLFAVRHARVLESGLLGVVLGTVWCFTSCLFFAQMVEAFMGVPSPASWLVGFVIALWCGGGAVGAVFLLYGAAQKATGAPSIVLLPLAWLLVWPVFPNPFFVTLGTGTVSAPFTVQATEFFGAYVLDAVLVLASAAVFEALQRPATRARRVAVGVAVAIVVAWWGYGAVASSVWDARVASWSTKRVGLIQPNRASSFKRLRPEPGYSRQFPFEMELSQQLAGEGAELIVWPEVHWYGTVANKKLRDVFHGHVRDMGVDLIIHDKGADPERGREFWRNASVFYPSSGEPVQMYFKRRLVPFGEYYPVLDDFPELKKSIGLPGSIAAGERKTTFIAGGMRVDPLICYEITFPRHVADAVGADAQGKVLLVQSNDGWYGEGTAPAHHRAATTLRAVENRVPVIHSLNSGESHIVGPHGRVHFLAPDDERGKWLVEMPYAPDSGGSFYSRFPGWPVWLTRVVATLWFSLWLFRRRLARREASGAAV